MVTIGIQDIRFDFARVKSTLERGEELLLTYRNKPLARILPLTEKAEMTDDPALEFGLVSESLEPLGNQEIDKAIYG